jgi:selenide, water dikinase
VTVAGPRLTSMAAGGGCACKLPAADLAAVLSGLPAVTDPRVLAGTTGFDDGAVIGLTADLALVQTVDFFTPLVDDPYDFGRIAATNAISDVYAMGGEPLCALAIAGFPRDLDPATVTAVFAGGVAAAREAGIAIVGGHTIVDPEPKYGLVVSGTVRPDAIWRNSGGRAGDVLVLTKALGTGVVANALRSDAAPDDVLVAAIASMTTLNRDGARALRLAGEPHAVTDVTGFGLIGHLHELAEASGLTARLHLEDLPILPGVLELARAGHVPGGSRRNREAADAFASFAVGHDPLLAAIACDAQTSGGLLAAVPPGGVPAEATVIGHLEQGDSGLVLVD